MVFKLQYKNLDDAKQTESDKLPEKMNVCKNVLSIIVLKQQQFKG